MKHLGQRYVPYVNRAYRRRGTLWEGRFRSGLTQSEDQVFACYRYIELNPVRADMVRHPRAYSWSSYRANGEGYTDRRLTPHAEYRHLGRRDEERRNNYRELFNTHLNLERISEIRNASHGNYALGDNRFKTEIERATPEKGGRPVREVTADG